MIEMEERLISLLDECLAAVETGESVDSWLAGHPDEARELAPLLQIALALEKLPQPGPTASTTRNAKRQFLTEAERRRASAQGQPVGSRLADSWTRLRRFLSGVRASLLQPPAWPAPVRALATVALSLVVALLIGGGVVYAASGSLPGDPLYGFKLLGEDVRYALTFGHESRIWLEETFTERRRAEVAQLLAVGRQEQVEFGGLLRGRNGERWQIEEIPVVVDVNTRVQAEPSDNTFVEVHGLTQADGTVLAQLIEIEGDEIIGLIEAIEGHQWQVAGQRIQIDDRTHLGERFQEGDCVEVHARQFPDGTLLALEIERTQGCQEGPVEGEHPARDETPTPALTPTVDATPTATATPTPDATATPTPTSEPEDGEVEETATPTLQPRPSPTAPPPGPPPTPTEDAEDDGNDNDNDDNDNNDGKDDNDNGGNDNEDDDDEGGNDNDDDDNDNDGDDDDDNDNEGG